jgi:hypothetical protein
MVKRLAGQVQHTGRVGVEILGISMHLSGRVFSRLFRVVACLCVWLYMVAIGARVGCWLPATVGFSTMVASVLYYYTRPLDPPSVAVEGFVGAVTGIPTSAGTDIKLSAATEKWLHRAILKFGRLQDTPADRRVLRLWLGGEMEKADMRHKDAVSLIPLVVEMMFIPGVEELVAARIRKSVLATMLKQETTK